MRDATILVLSRNPPGGRCRLYTRFAEALCQSFGATLRVHFPEGCGEPEAPGLLLADCQVLPSDGVIISADDICDALAGLGCDPQALIAFKARLEAIVEETLGAG